MTVAPMMPMATSSSSPESHSGWKPETISAGDGLQRKISMTKHSPMMEIRPRIRASILRMP